MSILPQFSTVLERLFCKRMLSFISSQYILYSKHFSYQPRNATQMTPAAAVDNISVYIENGDSVLALFLDF